MPNKQGLSAVQRQSQTQIQTLTPLQVLAARLTELPVNDLKERINKELEENPWLQAEPAESPDPEFSDISDFFGSSEPYDYDEDDIPYDPNRSPDEQRQRELRDSTESFFDYLVGQLGEYDLTDHEQEVMKYLIGSLENDGLLRTPLYQIVDELDIYQNIQTTEQELERLLVNVLQQMEPAGVGGRDLRECLILQVKRNYQGHTRELLITLFERHWGEFSLMHWKRIQQLLRIDELELERLRTRIRRLTPRPGGSIGGDKSDNHAVTPDFIATTDENGTIHFQLNEGDIPRLTISPDADQELSMPVVSRSDREAMRYLREQIGNAKMFIDAIKQRRETMLNTMNAIIRLQRPFFLEGDETSLKPMKLEDVASKTGQDISTVSRVSNSKFVQTNHGIYPLRWFFTSAATQNGDEVTIRKILNALKEIVAGEDKSHPYSDERLTTLLKERGYDVARRTVAKYRTQLGIAESRLRKL